LVVQHLNVSSHRNVEEQTPVAVIDRFWLLYWGSVAAVVLLAAYLSPRGKQTDNSLEADGGQAVVKVREDERDEDEDEADGEEEGVELPENMWALILIAALGQATIESSDKVISMWWVVVLAVFMAMIQITALFLMIHDLDPHASPYTVKPSTPFGSAWTVNSMKVIMSIFMTIALVGEAGQVYNVVNLGMRVKAEKLGRKERLAALTMEVFQYVIGICVTWSGVAVILSFQSVPDIVYSSMSVLAISGVDEMFYSCFDAICGLNADFKIPNKDIDEKYEAPLPLRVLLRFSLAFPMLLGAFVLARAWHTGTMPTERVRSFLEDVASLI